MITLNSLESSLTPADAKIRVLLSNKALDMQSARLLHMNAKSRFEISAR